MDSQDDFSHDMVFPVVILLFLALVFVPVVLSMVLRMPIQRLRYLEASVHLMQSRVVALVEGGRVSSSAVEGLTSELAQTTAVIHAMMWDWEEARDYERVEAYYFKGNYRRLNHLCSQIAQLRADIRGLGMMKANTAV